LQDDFNLFVIEGYGHKEIAVMLNISEGTSKSQLNASKTKLKELVNNLYYQKRNSHGQSRKIFKNKKFKKAEEKLSCNGKVWMREEKLDEKEDKKILYFGKISHCRFTLLFSHWDTSLLKPIRK
jgi:hypothetical protein